MMASYWTNRKFLSSLFWSSLFLVLSLIFQFYAGTYATEQASNPVTDIVLSNTRVYNVGFVFVYGALTFWLFIAFLCVRQPQRIPFVFKTITLFVVIRSFFISLTHIGPFPEYLAIDSNIMSRFAFGGDLFFSGHTGIPFLAALIFWSDRNLRLFFIAAAALFGIIVLLAHLHYTIDVVAAFFITYSIYRLAEIFFKKDRLLFDSGII